MSQVDQIQFRTVREDWTVIRLSNGTIYRLKSPLASIRPNPAKPGGRDIEVSKLVSIEPVAEDMGEPSGNDAAEAEDEVGPVDFEVISEPINIYETDEPFLIITRPFALKVTKTRVFDKKGVRIFRVEVRMAIAPISVPTRADAMKRNEERAETT